jgi:hypothetical protein
MDAILSLQSRREHMTQDQHKALKTGDKVVNLRTKKVYTVSSAYEATTNWGATQLGWYVLAQPMNVVIKPSQVSNWQLA